MPPDNETLPQSEIDEEAINEEEIEEEINDEEEFEEEEFDGEVDDEEQEEFDDEEEEFVEVDDEEEEEFKEEEIDGEVDDESTNDGSVQAPQFLMEPPPSGGPSKLPPPTNDPPPPRPPPPRPPQRDLQEVPDTDVTPDRGSLLHGMLQSDFTGASGRVFFDAESKQRKAIGITIGAYNIRPGPINEGTGKRSYDGVLVSKYKQFRNRWDDVVGAEVVYRDGTTLISDVTREVFEQNLITDSVRAIGLTLMAFAWLLALIALVLVQVLGKEPVITRAQPFFLKLLCVGSLLMSTAIFTLSWDEGAGWTDHQLDIACTLTPWFFFVGQILTFCSLFTKLWRVDEVLQFRRRAVTISNVMKPTAALLFLTLAVLVIWTVLDPWHWVREVISEIPAETYGECRSEHFWAFLGPLVGLTFVAETVTLYYAWKTADVPEDFRDSGAVMYASFAQLQSWAVGVPMLTVLGNASADATYFGRVFLIWIFAVSSVVVVIGPKLVKAIRMKLNPELLNKRGRVSVTGVYNNSAPSQNRTSSLQTNSISNSRSLKVSSEASSHV